LEIKVYGPGCKNYLRLIENLEQAIKELTIEVEVKKITDLNKIVAKEIRRTPALSINEELKFQGEVLTSEELKELIVKNK